MKLIDLTGNRYGMLVVVEQLPRCSGDTMWKTRCDCGNEGRAGGQNLRTGKIRSCGCSRWRKGSDHHQWGGYGKISGAKWRLIQNRSRYRKSRQTQSFDITIEYAWELYERQRGRCALTGLPIGFGEKQSDPETASLDRIDSKLGYVVGNVQWVHKDINRMKNAFDQDYFIAMCRAVSAHADKKD